MAQSRLEAATNQYKQLSEEHSSKVAEARQLSRRVEKLQEEAQEHKKDAVELLEINQVGCRLRRGGVELG